MSKLKYTIAIKVNENLTKLLSIKELNNGDLNIHTTSGGKSFSSDLVEDMIIVKDEKEFQESSKHISIHTNPDSNTTNTIKKTIEYRDKKETLVQISSGIKIDDEYIPILFRVCGNQSRDRYIMDNINNTNIINFGNYEPSTDQLRLMLFVSSNNKKFNFDIEHPTNYKFVEFTNFRLHILWSYFNKSSIDHALDFFLFTKQEMGIMRGFNWYEIYNFYTSINMNYIIEYFKQEEFFNA